MARRFTYYSGSGSVAHGAKVTYNKRGGGGGVFEDLTAAGEWEEAIVLRRDEEKKDDKQYTGKYTMVASEGLGVIATTKKGMVGGALFQDMARFPSNHTELMHELKMRGYKLKRSTGEGALEILTVYRVARGGEALYFEAGKIEKHSVPLELRPPQKCFGYGHATRTGLQVGEVIVCLEWQNGQQTYLQIVSSFEGVSHTLVPRRNQLTYFGSMPSGFKVKYGKEGAEYKLDVSSLRIQDRVTLAPMLPTDTTNMSGLARLRGNVILIVGCIWNRQANALKGMVPVKDNISKIPWVIWRAHIFEYLRVSQIPLCIQKRDGGRGRVFPMCVSLFSSANEKRRSATQTTKEIEKSALKECLKKVPAIKSLVETAKKEVTDVDRAKFKSLRYLTVTQTKSELSKKRGRDDGGEGGASQKRTKYVSVGENE